jgi:O-antigen ligase
LVIVAALLLMDALAPGAHERASFFGLGKFQFDPSWISRTATWEYVWRLWLQNPLGTGYMDTIPPYYMTAHSLYLGLLLTTGPIGLVAYLVFFSLCLRYWLSALDTGNPTCNWICIGAIGVVIVSLVAGVTADHLSRFGMYITLWAVCGIATAAVKATKAAHLDTVPSYSRWYPTKMFGVKEPL